MTRTKFVVPRTRSDQIDRPRLRAILARTGDAPVTLVVAGAGYGKTSLVAGFAAELADRTVWYGLKDRDADPGVFVRHLTFAVSHWLDGPPLAMDEPIDAGALLDTLSDRLQAALAQDVWLILDDAHVLNRSPSTIALLDQWLGILPERLHLILVSRETPAVPSWARLTLHGDATIIDQAALAFDDEELARLAAQAGTTAGPGFEALLRERSAGWPIVAHLLCRHPQTETAQAGVTADALADYVINEVLQRLNPEELAWLEAVSVLPELQPMVCQAVTGLADSGQRLKQLIRQGLPIRMTAEQRFELHPLIREALSRRMAADDRLATAKRTAADALHHIGDTESALSLMIGDDTATAVDWLIETAPHWLSTGRSHSVLALCQQVPAHALSDRPRLLLYQAEAFRRSGQLESAVSTFTRACQAFGSGSDGLREALLGQAMVYLDTVQPQKAKPLLAQALASAHDPVQIRQIERLLTENALNTGTQTAAAADDGAPTAGRRARSHLRRGELAEARQILETALLDPDVSTIGDGGHRQESLILAFVASQQGDAPTALHWARHGLERARACGSLPSEAVALARLGHALAIDGQTTAAIDAYGLSADLADTLRIPRLAVEAWFGAALLTEAGEQGGDALVTLAKAARVTQDSGDAWLASYIQLATAIVRRTTGDAGWLDDVHEAASRFQACGDTFGQGLCDLWQHVAAGDTGVPDPWQWALQRQSLFGPCGRLHVQAHPIEASPKARLEVVDRPQAPCLEVNALGPLQIRLHGTVVPEKAWSRRKAKALFAAFLTERRRALPKARLLDLLWPDLDGDKADGSFRVALNALQQALPLPAEGGQGRRIIERDGSLYRLNRIPGVRIDADDFENGLDAASAADASEAATLTLYRQALSTYGGQLLADMEGDLPWIEPERERLQRRFVTGALRFAGLLIEQAQPDEAIHWAERILQEDILVEEAYRRLIQAHAAAGDRARAVLAFERCEQVMADELGVTPMPETLRLFEAVTDSVPSGR
jgi:ATP/maltotriose-dependent transcriptional regulator MalT/DNA-binding SARP family transcriptional activator